ncbi:LacI family DNA-binding transcriptional regulator [Microbacterium gorillae]|uniref:LacI family DNA-binding transcriptional regulator n=1 Tax=Microbacterium gorillae TaxID=1231063 RepID=UPI003D954993
MTTHASGARRITIRDVAARAGVSTSSASLVLRSAAGVSAETRQRVEQAMAELDYRPLASARGMRGKTFTIGVLVSDIHNPFFGILLDGVIERFTGTGYEPLIGPGGATAPSQTRMIQAMRDRQMDGLILIGPHVAAADLESIAAEIPMVVVGRHGPADHFDTVAGDDERGSHLIVDHLVGLGHRRISYVTHWDPESADDRRPENRRELGYIEAMQRHGLANHIDVIREEWSHDGGLRAAATLVSRPQRPTAVHAGADVSAFGLLTGLAEAGLATPDDISVAGYDNTVTSALPRVSLTSIDQSGHEIGRVAADLLLDRIDGRRRSVHEVTAPTLAVRSSTAPPAI